MSNEKFIYINCMRHSIRSQQKIRPEDAYCPYCKLEELEPRIKVLEDKQDPSKYNNLEKL